MIHASQAQRKAQQDALEAKSNRTKQIQAVMMARQAESDAKDAVRFGLDLERQKILTGIMGIQREMQLQPQWERRRRMEEEQGSLKAEQTMADQWRQEREAEAIRGPIRAAREAPL